MVALRAPTPLVTPAPRPVDLLSAVRAPFRVHPSSPLRCHALGMVAPYPKWAVSGGQRSVGEPAPRARTTGPGYRACKPRELIRT